jgi:hypothetical protein
LNCFLDFHEVAVRGGQVDFFLTRRRADVAGDVEVEIVLLDLRHFDTPEVAWLFFSELMGIDDPGDMLLRQLVLAFAFDEVFGGVDEEHVVGLLALLQVVCRTAMKQQTSHSTRIRQATKKPLIYRGLLPLTLAVEFVNWAMRDSNPRHPLCKNGALTS